MSSVATFQSVSSEILPPVVGRMRAEVPQVDIGLFETRLPESPHIVVPDE